MYVYIYIYIWVVATVDDESSTVGAGDCCGSLARGLKLWSSVWSSVWSSFCPGFQHFSIFGHFFVGHGLSQLN